MGNIISQDFFEHWILHRHIKNRKSVMTWSIKKSPLTQNSNNQKRCPHFFLVQKSIELFILSWKNAQRMLWQNTEEKKRSRDVPVYLLLSTSGTIVYKWDSQFPLHCVLNCLGSLRFIDLTKGIQDIFSLPCISEISLHCCEQILRKRWTPFC